MKKAFLASAAAALVALATVAAPSTADARCRGCGAAAGIIGGLAAGAIIGGAIANSGPSYYGGPGYYAPPPPNYYYGGPAYVEGPVCRIERRRFWDGYGYRIRRVEVCD